MKKIIKHLLPLVLFVFMLSIAFPTNALAAKTPKIASYEGYSEVPEGGYKAPNGWYKHFCRFYITNVEDNAYMQLVTTTGYHEDETNWNGADRHCVVAPSDAHYVSSGKMTYTLNPNKSYLSSNNPFYSADDTGGAVFQTSGKYSIKVRTSSTLSDRNTYDDWVTASFNIDTNSPTYSQLNASTLNWSNSNVTLTAKSIDAHSGLYSMILQYKKTSSDSWSDLYTLAKWEGNTTINSEQTKSYVTDTTGYYRLVATDKVGLTQNSDSIYVKIDKAAPSISVSDISATWCTSDTVTISKSDNDSGLAYYAVTNSNSTPTSWIANTQGSVTWTASANGTYYAWVKDAVGNTAYKSFTINKIDKTAPSVSVSGIATTWCKSNTITISKSDTQSGIAYYAITNNVATPGSWISNNQNSISWTANENGMYYVWAKDAVGNTAYKSFVIDKIDTTAPTASYKLSGQIIDGYYKNSVKITVSGQDTQSGIYSVTIDETVKQATTNDITYSTSGTKVFTYYVTDYAGNKSTVNTISVKVDNDIPVTDVLIKQDNLINNWYSGSVYIDFMASDKTSGVNSISINDINYSDETDTSVYSIEENKSGTHTYDYFATDNVGNVSNTEELIINIDNESPTALEMKQYNTGGQHYITISGEDKHSGISNITVYISNNNKDFSKLHDYSCDNQKTYTHDIKIDKNGYYYYEITDAAGNTSKSKSIFADGIDETGPSIDISANTKSWASYEKGVTLTAIATDNKSGIKNITTYFKNKGTQIFTEVSTTDYGEIKKSAKVNNTFYKNGIYKVIATDGINTTEALYEISNIDLHKPELEVTNIVTDNYVKAEDGVTINITASDNESGIKDIKLYCDDSFVTTINTGNFTISNNGNYEIICTDNVGLKTSFTFNINCIISNAPNGINIVPDTTKWIDYETGVLLTLYASNKECPLQSLKLSSVYDTIESTIAVFDNFNNEDSIITEQYRIYENGNYKLTATNKAGYESSVMLTVTNIDSTAPEASLDLNINKELINGYSNSLSLISEAKDFESGLAYIEILHDGDLVETINTQCNKTNSYEYEITSNGVYTFIYKNAADMTSELSIEIKCYDNEAPNVNLDYNSDLISEEEGLYLVITLNDTLSGLNNITLAGNDTGIITSSDDYVSGTTETYILKYLINDNDTYTLTATDMAGNMFNTTFKVTNIISEGPMLLISGIPTEWTNRTCPVSITALKKEADLSSLTINDEILEISDTECTNYVMDIDQNIKGSVSAADIVNNITSIDYEINYIDTSVPNINVKSAEWTDEGYSIEYDMTDDLSGISSIVVNGVEILSSKDSNENTKNTNNSKLYFSDSVSFADAGDYRITCTDLAGNKSSKLITAPKQLDEQENGARNYTTIDTTITVPDTDTTSPDTDDTEDEQNKENIDFEETESPDKSIQTDIPFVDNTNESNTDIKNSSTNKIFTVTGKSTSKKILAKLLDVINVNKKKPIKLLEIVETNEIQTLSVNTDDALNYKEEMQKIDINYSKNYSPSSIPFTFNKAVNGELSVKECILTFVFTVLYLLIVTIFLFIIILIIKILWPHVTIYSQSSDNGELIKLGKCFVHKANKEKTTYYFTFKDNMLFDDTLVIQCDNITKKIFNNGKNIKAFKYLNNKLHSITFSNEDIYKNDKYLYFLYFNPKDNYYDDSYRQSHN